MKRRECLSALGVVAATVAGSPTETAAAGQFSGKIRKAIKYQMIGGRDQSLSVEDKFRLVKDIGFDGIEVRSEAKADAEESLAAYERAQRSTGLPIHGIIHSSNPDLRLAIDQAKRLGGTSVLHVVRYNKNISYLQNYRETLDIIRRASDHAAKRDVMILVENVWASYLIEPMGMARFLDQVGSPMAGAYFDIGNVVRWGWPEHWIEVLGKRIKKLDVKEYDLDIAMTRGMRRGFDGALGAGSIDWAKVRQQLAQIDFQGWATAEVPGGDRDRLADIANQMDQVLDLK